MLLYIISFNNLAYQTGWNDMALLSQFKANL